MRATPSRDSTETSQLAQGTHTTMAVSTPSISRVHEILGELRQGIRRIELVEPGARADDDAWTTRAIEVPYSIQMLLPDLQ